MTATLTESITLTRKKLQSAMRPLAIYQGPTPESIRDQARKLLNEGISQAGEGYKRAVLKIAHY